MKPARSYSRHGLNAVKAQVKLRGLAAIDMRTVAAREMLAFRDELVAALGGDTELSPQRRKLVDLATRASLYLDHLDAWLAGQQTLVHRRSRSVLPVLLQRQSSAASWARSTVSAEGRDQPGANDQPNKPGGAKSRSTVRAGENASRA